MANILDPTREEMLAVLTAHPFASEFSEFDREEALYWFCNDFHGGQCSNLYSVLSTSEFHPGPLANGPEEPAGMLYESLVDAFAVVVADRYTVRPADHADRFAVWDRRTDSVVYRAESLSETCARSFADRHNDAYRRATVPAGAQGATAAPQGWDSVQS